MSSQVGTCALKQFEPLGSLERPFSGLLQLKEVEVHGFILRKKPEKDLDFAWTVIELLIVNSPRLEKLAIYVSDKTKYQTFIDSFSGFKEMIAKLPGVSSIKASNYSSNVLSLSLI